MKNMKARVALGYIKHISSGFHCKDDYCVARDCFNKRIPGLCFCKNCYRYFFKSSFTLSILDCLASFLSKGHPATIKSVNTFFMLNELKK